MPLIESFIDYTRFFLEKAPLKCYTRFTDSAYRQRRRPSMTILGIIAEYDPFHNGHLYHLNEAKKRVQPDFTYIVLSPCLKQRGTFSMLSPLDRARLALEAGADAVFALPVLWTVRDAEHYALGAVSMLASLGVTHLAFGAETADLPLLQRTADRRSAGQRQQYRIRLDDNNSGKCFQFLYKSNNYPDRREQLRIRFT